MALAKDSKRTTFTTNVLKDTKSIMEELKNETGLPISKLTDMAFKLLHEKIKNEGVTIKID